MDLVEEFDDPAVPVKTVCEVLTVSRATLYRTTTPPTPPAPREAARSHRRLPDEERQQVLDVLHTPEFADQPPTEVFATLLSRGVYMASIRTMYRLLAERGETLERRAQRLPQAHAKPSLTATAPHQVWTWDITKLATTEPGVFLCAYVIIDLFSRYVVGWMVAERESKVLAEQLFAETIDRHGVEPGQLVVHADRGSAMKSDTLAQLFASLGVTRSFSRPHVSDDNAFSEAQFKTLKYQPDYPGRFASVEHARGWLQEFFGWHNEEHHHVGLALFTPADVFHGRVPDVAAKRQRALDAAYARTPERFPNGAPRVTLPPATVSINPLDPSPTQETANDNPTTMQPESEVPAGGALRPSSAAHATPTPAAKGKRAPGAARSHAQRSEHGEDREEATLPAARTPAPCPPRWAEPPQLTAIAT
jgi:transposase InsO family protein